MKQFVPYEGQHCANCGAAMQGEFCHECGQSIHSVLKPIHGMLEDTLDIVFHVDGRVVHTLPPLFLKPGFLTLEYFSGRRVRYIAPFRLMFVLSLLAFFVIHLRIDAMSDKFGPLLHVQASMAGSQFQDAKSPDEVRATLKDQLDDLDAAKRIDGIPQATVTELGVDAQKLHAQANQRLIDLHAEPMPAASLAAPATAASLAIPDTTSDRTAIAERRGLDKKMQPVHIAWLPGAANARLTRIGEHVLANWHTYKHGDAAAREESKERMLSGFFGVLPPTMFVLMPIFALLLKLFYVFKRRLYIEHLIVALHSHAFLFLNLLLGMLVSLLTAWVTPHIAWLAYPLGWIGAALWLWAPIYLLIMQKRIYRQGWPMTIVKYLAVGWCYCWILTFALLIAGVLGLAH